MLKSRWHTLFFLLFTEILERGRISRRISGHFKHYEKGGKRDGKIWEKAPQRRSHFPNDLPRKEKGQFSMQMILFHCREWILFILFSPVLWRQKNGAGKAIEKRMKKILEIKKKSSWDGRNEQKITQKFNLFNNWFSEIRGQDRSVDNPWVV